MRALVLVLPLLLSACPPTLSRSRSPAFDARLAQAERDAHHGRDDEAAAGFGEAAALAERRVDRDEARYRQARTLHDAGQHAEALALFDAIAATRPTSRRTVRALFDASKLRQEQGDTVGAQAGFLRVVREHPESGVAGRALHWLLRGETPGSTVARLVSLDAEVGETSLGDDILMRMHDEHVALEELAAAREDLELLVERHPYPHGERWDDAILLLAAMDLQAQDPDAALERLERMLERAESTHLSGSYTLPGFPKAHLLIAQIHRDAVATDAARRSDADRWYRTLEDEFPTSLLRDDAAVERAFMWLDAGDTERGCAILEDALEEFEVGHARRLGAERHARDCTPE
ncbi:MAG: tol-pal system YbgF family protein [Polyangiales bacterium]